MKRNVKTIFVKFSRIYNNPTFNSLFDRVKELKQDVWIEMNVNHKHYSDIQRMASVFNYEIK